MESHVFRPLSSFFLNISNYILKISNTQDFFHFFLLFECYTCVLFLRKITHTSGLKIIIIIKWSSKTFNNFFLNFYWNYNFSNVLSILSRKRIFFFCTISGLTRQTGGTFNQNYQTFGREFWCETKPFHKRMYIHVYYHVSSIQKKKNIQMLNAIPCVYQQDTYIRSINVLKLIFFLCYNEALSFFYV